MSTPVLPTIEGEVRLGRHDRMLYSTDASLYQVEPIGVVIPASASDVVRALERCAADGTPVLGRGGGTSLAGQCTSRAVVLDCSAGLRGVRDLRTASDGATCVAEAGVALADLNALLARDCPGWFFAPDPATVRQATVGGCLGNNAAGSRSIRYGRTSENVLGIEVVTTSGWRGWLEAGAGANDPCARELAAGVMDVCARHAGLIRERFPTTVRRNAGYGLDMILSQMDEGATPETLDLSGLLCGSEGTLALTLSARLRLRRCPDDTVLTVMAFESVEAAIDAVVPILGTGPSAVEMLDDMVLDAARGNVQCAEYVRLLPRPDAAAVLYVEHASLAGEDGAASGPGALAEMFPDAPMIVHRDASSAAPMWALRKAGEPLLHGLSATRKPISFVEDNAIPVERLGEFVRRFKELVARHGTKASYWAHASVGVLHIRPMIDLHDEADRARMRAIAIEAADLARSCGGVMSGEHGDGRARGPLLERYYGPELMGAFAEVKRLFDPAGILNPGNIVGAGPIESMTERLRVRPAASPALVPEVETYFDYEDQEGFGGAVEMCNGAGVCRKRSGGVMCPSYMGTADERHSTRGRANALRLAITGQLETDGRPSWNDPETIGTLDWCLSCKACKSECPSNVDVARMKAEYTAQRFRSQDGPDLRSRLLANPRVLNRMGSLLPGVANALNRSAPVRSVIDRAFGFAPERSLPRFEASLWRWLDRRGPSRARDERVVLFPDCFTTYNEPRVGRATVRVLESLGYDVVVPRTGCCGRAAISMGVLDDARRHVERASGVLASYASDPSVTGIVVCEPSCLSAIRDDWLQLKSGVDRSVLERIASASWLPEAFVDAGWGEHPEPATVRPVEAPMMLHGHCHQKTLWGVETSAGLMRRLSATPELVSVPDTTCCGMAGSFGYASSRYELSMAIGERSVFPAVREAPEGSVVVAPGTSCRHQIHDGVGASALHPMEIAAMALCSEPGPDAG